MAILEVKIIFEKINFFKNSLNSFYNAPSCDFPGIQNVLAAFFTLMLFVNFKTANFCISCLKIKFYFLRCLVVATRKLQPKKNSHAEAKKV